MSSRRRTRKAMLLVLTVLLVSMLGAVSTYALTLPKEDAVGSISVSMKDPQTGEAVPGGSMDLYKVGDIHYDDGNYGWVLTSEFAPSGADLSKLDSEDLVQGLASYADSNGLKPITTEAVGNDGRAVFSNQGVGLYMIYQRSAAEKYELSMPFLVTIPMKAPEGEGWIYDVDASPKVEIKRAPTPTDTPTPTPSASPTPTLPSTATPTPTTPPGKTPTPRITTPPRVTQPPRVTVRPKVTTQPVQRVLPKTGQLWWPVAVLLVVGLVLFSSGMRKKSMKKNTDGDES